MPPLTRPTASIDLEALADNYRLLTDRAGGTAPAGIVKADAYGLGAGPVARRLVAEGCTRLFVARLDEGLVVRDALGAVPRRLGSARPVEIHVLDGPLPGTERDLAAAGLIPVLNDLDQIGRWSGLARTRGTALPAVLHLDTGMTRLGVPAVEADRLAADPSLLAGIDVRIVMSHLASADVAGSDQPRRQLDRFRSLRRHFGQGLASLANSAGTFLGGQYHFDLVRPGIALYGGAPLPDQETNPMGTVVTVVAPVVQVQSVPAGTSVGYGATHMTGAEARLATVAVGYADGILRSVGRLRTVCIGGRPSPVVGRVSMDLISVDVSDRAPGEVVAGTAVEILGPNRPLDAVATEAGTIANEILTQLSARYARTYRGDPASAPPGERPDPGRERE